MSQSQKWGKLERLITWRRLHSVARLPRVNAEALVKGYWAMRDWRDREIGWMLAVWRLMLHQNHCRTLWPVTSTMTNTAPSTDTFSTSWTQAVLAHALLTQSALTQTTSFFQHCFRDWANSFHIVVTFWNYRKLSDQKKWPRKTIVLTLMDWIIV